MEGEKGSTSSQRHNQTGYVWRSTKTPSREREREREMERITKERSFPRYCNVPDCERPATREITYLWSGQERNPASVVYKREVRDTDTDYSIFLCEEHLWKRKAGTRPALGLEFNAILERRLLPRRFRCWRVMSVEEYEDDHD